MAGEAIAAQLQAHVVVGNASGELAADPVRRQHHHRRVVDIDLVAAQRGEECLIVGV
jgi:hypothetical protein